MRAVWRAASRMVASALLVLALLAPHTVALAQPADPSPPDLAAAQPRVQVTLVPGAAAEGEVRFTYSGDAPATGEVSVLDYRVGPDGESVSPAGGQGAAGWVTVTPPALELQPHAAVAVRYRIQVPRAVPSGDHSALVLLETDQADPGAPRAGVRLTVNVPGEARHQAELLSFGAEREPLRLLWLELSNGPPLFDGGPIQLRAQARNAGDVQLDAGGAIEVVDLFGSTVASFDLPTETVYPGDTGSFAARWTDPPPLGWFTTRLVLEAAGSPLVAEERLLILPWPALLGCLLIIIFLCLMLGRGFGPPLPARRATPADVGDEPVPPVGREASLPAGRTANGVLDESDVLELLRLGQQAARAGGREQAHRFFVRALKLDPDNEEAWLWRAGTAAHPREAIRSLEQVLLINPDNVRARRGLEELQRRCAPSQG